jgi:hypothetical protein
MHPIRAKTIPAHALFLTASLLAFCAHADGFGLPATVTLPDLPAADYGPASFAFDRQKAEFLYAGRERRWSARLDQASAVGRALTLDYGVLLNDSLGAGAALRRGSEYSDLWINGVFAPQRGLRLHVAGGQLRAGEAGALTGSGTVQQNSYLLGAQRAWKAGPLSSLGVAAFAVDANEAGAATGADYGFGVEPEPVPFAGRQQGHVLNLSLRPYENARIELRRERSRLSLRGAEALTGERELVANRVRFSQLLDNCTRLQGGYSANEDTNRVDLGVAMKRWQVNVSRTDASGDRSLAFGLGYRIPLGGTVGGGTRCGVRLEERRSFETIIDSTVRRPAQFPHAPLNADGAG